MTHACSVAHSMGLHSFKVGLEELISSDVLHLGQSICGKEKLFLLDPMIGHLQAGGGGNFNRRVTGVCHLTSEIAP